MIAPVLIVYDNSTMKKSSLLHNPKNMLSRSFKPAKCKTSLKLAASRLKLMKNKKEVQLNQMKRELAQLLDSGKHQTARIRVEHVIREQKMMAAYDLIEIYCELIAARLAIIESQKNCPIDLKEAITSVIFASPRCGDIPELLDIQKHLTAKYGKEFTSAAIELRPDCGVSRMLVEKLSARAPDGDAKIKVLTAIAEEHNVKWDPKAFGDSETLPNDLLNGPTTFDNASKMHAESPQSVPGVQVPPSHQGMHNQPFSSPEQNVRTQNLPTQFTGVSNVVSPISQSEQRFSGTRSNRTEIKQELHGEDDAFSFSQQSWSMDFKDATSAAQAAAESAERASMAARAAAQLSSRGRIDKQHSIESHKSGVHVRRDGGTTNDSTSKYTSDYNLKDLSNASIVEPHTRVLNEQNSKSERSYLDDYDSDKRSPQTFSSRSKGSFDNDPAVHNVRRADEYSRKYSSKEDEMRAEIRMPSDESEDESQSEYGNRLPESFSSDKFGYTGEEITKKQSNSIFSGSNSIVSGVEDQNLSAGNIMLGPNFGDDHSIGLDRYKQEDSLQSHTHDSGGGAVFDESGSDGEDLGFDMGSHHEDIYARSPDRNSTNTGAGGPLNTSKLQESEFSTKRNSFQEFAGSAEATIDDSQSNDLGSVRFDDSDGQSSEDETAMGNSLGSRSSYAERDWNNDQRRKNSVESPQNFSSGEAPTSFSSPRWGKSQLESNDSHSEPQYHHSVNEENRHDLSESRFSLVREDELNSSRSHVSEMNDENFSKELNFGKLTGGFRQKGNTHPPYVRNHLDNLSSSYWKGDEERPRVIPQSEAPPAMQSSKTGESEEFGTARKSRVANSHYDSDSDSSEEFEEQLSNRAQEPYVRSIDKDVKSKTTLRGPVTYFDSETSDSEDDSAKQIPAGRSRLGAGVSRRTKAYPSNSGSISHPKGHASSLVLEKSDSVGRNPQTGFYGTGSRPSQSLKKYSVHTSDFQPSNSAEVGSKISSPEKSRKFHGVEQPLNSKKTPETSDSFETQKISSQSFVNRDDSGKKSSQVHQKKKPEASHKIESQKKASENSIAREDSGKKASHVHPNLPDYDTLAARIQALRTRHE